MRPRRRRIGGRQPALRDFAIPLVMTSIMLVVGIVFGSVGAQTLDQSDKGELIEYLSRFGQSLADSISGARVPIQNAILTNLQKLAIIWVLAATVIGSPAILLVIFLQGFASGFTVAILVEEWSIRGLALALASVVPHNLFVVSGLVLSGSAGLGHAWSTVRAIATRFIASWKRLLSFSVVCLLCSVLLVLAAVVESQVSPFLVRKVAPFVFDACHSGSAAAPLLPVLLLLVCPLLSFRSALRSAQTVPSRAGPADHRMKVYPSTWANMSQ